MRRFLEWQRMTVSPMSPQDREVASAVKLLLDGDAAFAGALTEVSVHDGVVLITAYDMSDEQQSAARQLALIVPGARSVTFSTN
jgi:osmotically-inducible protein OsmY